MAGKRNLFDDMKDLAVGAEKALAVESSTVDVLMERPEDGAPYLAVEYLCSRITFFSRRGERWSYPYAYLGLAEMPNPGIMSVDCTCGHVEKITIRGRNLGDLARLLDQHRLCCIWESEVEEFAKESVLVAVEGVEIQLVETTTS